MKKNGGKSERVREKHIGKINEACVQKCHVGELV